MTELNEMIGVIFVAFGTILAVLIPLINAILKLNTTIGNLNSLIKMVNKDITFLLEENATNKASIRAMEDRYNDMQLDCVRTHSIAYRNKSEPKSGG